MSQPQVMIIFDIHRSLPVGFHLFKDFKTSRFYRYIFFFMAGSTTNNLLKICCSLTHKTLMCILYMMTKHGDLAAVCEYASGRGEEFDPWHSSTNVAAFILWLIVKCSFPKVLQLLFSFQPMLQNSDLSLCSQHVSSKGEICLPRSRRNRR